MMRLEMNFFHVNGYYGIHSHTRMKHSHLFLLLLLLIQRYLTGLETFTKTEDMPVSENIYMGKIQG